MSYVLRFTFNQSEWLHCVIVCLQFSISLLETFRWNFVALASCLIYTLLKDKFKTFGTQFCHNARRRKHRAYNLNAFSHSFVRTNITYFYPVFLTYAHKNIRVRCSKIVRHCSNAIEKIVRTRTMSYIEFTLCLLIRDWCIANIISPFTFSVSLSLAPYTSHIIQIV